MPRGSNLSKDRNLKGRPKGSKNKFTSYKRAAQESFAYQGEEAYLNRVAESDPAGYLAFIKAFIPKQIEMDINVHDFRAKLEAARKRVGSRAPKHSD